MYVPGIAAHRQVLNESLTSPSRMLAVTTAILAFASIPAQAQDQTVLAPIAITATEVAPGGVQITEEELERTNPVDIKDVFEKDPAVHVGGGSDVSRKIYVNGIENTNLNVKIDGARQVDSAFHHLGTAIIDPGILKTVRVETGVGPVDVGPNALGGSIAFETKDARDILDSDEMWGGFTRFQFNGNGPSHSEVATIAGQYEGFEALAYGSFKGGEEYEDGNGTVTAGTKPDMDNVIGKFAYSNLDGGRVEFHASHLDDTSIRPSRANFGALTNGASPTAQEFRRSSFSLSYKDEAPTEMINPEAVLSYNRSALSIHDLAFGPNIRELYSETTSISGKLANTISTGLGVAETGSVTIGTDFYRDEGHGIISAPIVNVGQGVDNTETSYNVGLFAQSRLNLTQRLRVSLGVRWDQQWFEGIEGTEISGGGPGGSANIEYDALTWLTGYAGTATTYGGIPLGESAIYNFSNQWDYEGLSSSRSYSHKLGIKGVEGPFSGDVHIYLTDIYGSHDRGSVTRNATRDLRSEGYNISGQYQDDGLLLRASFSNNRLRSDGAVLTSGVASFHGLQTGKTAALEVAKDWYDVGFSMGASAEYAFADSTQAATPNDSYLVANIFAEMQPVEYDFITMRLDVRNLFDRTYVDRATSGVDNAQVIPFNEPGRSVLATVKIDF